MNDIYAVVKRYANGNGDYFDYWCYNPDDHDTIYNKMMKLTNGDHEISDDAACWCELATVGEIYEFREGEIEIMDLEDIE